MATKWDELREMIGKVNSNFEDVSLGNILIVIVNELQKLSNEIHQGYTKPE